MYPLHQPVNGFREVLRPLIRKTAGLSAAVFTASLEKKDGQGVCPSPRPQLSKDSLSGASRATPVTNTTSIQQCSLSPWCRQEGGGGLNSNLYGWGQSGVRRPALWAPHKPKKPRVPSRNKRFYKPSAGPWLSSCWLVSSQYTRVRSPAMAHTRGNQ